jgi:hypothetical protein
MTYAPSNSLDVTTAGNVSVGDDTDFDLGSTWTIEGWFNIDSFNTLNVLAGKWQTSGNNRSYGVRIYDDSGDKKLQSFTDANGAAGSATVATSDIVTINTGTWYHAAFTCSSGTPGFYLDGVDVENGGSLDTPHNGTADFVLGAERTDGTDGFDGKMGLWRVWKGEARSQSEIQDNWCTLLGSTTNLSAEYSLDNVLTDNSGNGHTLSSNGGDSFSTSVPSVCVGTFTPKVIFF